jgi:hypothetical protein
MRVAGAWVGLGIGDVSEEVRALKAFMRRKFSYCRYLTDTKLFDAQMVAAVTEMQRRYKASNQIGLHTPGVVNLETKYAMDFLPRPRIPKPVVFTVEGHMSSMWVGPCAEVGRVLESQGVCKWQPVGYNNTALPFDNKSGVDELGRLLADRNLLPPGTPWGMCIFSQGGIVGSTLWLNEIAPATGSLHWRLKDWRATLAFGNPYRELNKVAEWVNDPPRPNTHGISNVRMANTPANWKEVSRRGDLYAEVEAGTPATEHMTSIYLAVQNQWAGHPDSLLNQMFEIATQPAPEFISMVQAISNGAMFLGNMGPHGIYDLPPCIEFMRSRITAPV